MKAPSFMDFFMPTAVETPHWETDFTVTPSPHHPIGAKGVGESPNVGGVPAFLQRRQRRLLVPGGHPHPDAARFLAHLAGGEELGRRLRVLAAWPQQCHVWKRRQEIAERLAASGYIADGELATAISLMQLLRRPLLLEGEAGVGKTEVAKALADVHGTELIRLQCYEGLDQSAALYEWNYQRQLLAIQAHRGDKADAIEDADLFGKISAGAAAVGRDPPQARRRCC